MNFLFVNLNDDTTIFLKFCNCLVIPTFLHSLVPFSSYLVNKYKQKFELLLNVSAWHSLRTQLSF